MKKNCILNVLAIEKVDLKMPSVKATVVVSAIIYSLLSEVFVVMGLIRSFITVSQVSLKLQSFTL